MAEAVNEIVEIATEIAARKSAPPPQPASRLHRRPSPPSRQR